MGVSPGGVPEWGRQAKYCLNGSYNAGLRAGSGSRGKSLIGSGTASAAEL